MMTTTVAAATLAAAALCLGAAPAAHADAPLLAAPGEKILQFKGDDITGCTLGFAARDDAGDRLAITAGHCGVLGEPVYDRGHRRLGTYVDVHPDDIPDQTYGYSIIALDSDVSMIADMSQTQAIDVPGQAHPGDVVCMYGITSGMQCSALETVDTHAATTIGSITHPGDSGAPVVRLADSALVGIIIGHNDIQQVTFIEPLSQILRQTNAEPQLHGFAPVVTHPDT